MPKSKRKHTINRLSYKIALTLGIAFAVISFWRGAWGLMDLYIFPNNQTLSFVASLAIGLLVLFGTHKILKVFK